MNVPDLALHHAISDPNCSNGMQEPLLCFASTTLVPDAIAELISVSNHTTSMIALVVENDQVVGCVTEQGLVQAIATGQPDEQSVADIMHRDVDLMLQTEFTSPFVALQQLQCQHTLAIAVVDGQQQPRGCITPGSLAIALQSQPILDLWPVGKLATSSVLHVSQHLTLAAAIALMLNHNASCLWVVDSPIQPNTQPATEISTPSIPLGILTLTDALRGYHRAKHHNRSLNQICLAELIQDPVVSIPAATPVQQAMHQLQQQATQHLVITQSNHLCLGLFCLENALNAFTLLELNRMATKLQGMINRQTSALGQEIANQRQLTHALANSELRYQAVVESQTDLVCRFLADGTITFANAAYCNYLGKTLVDLIGENFLSFIAESDRSRVEQHLQDLATQTSMTRSEERLIAHNGEIYWQEWVDYPILGDSGEIIEFQGVGRDISDRKRVEVALQNSEERFRVIFEQAAIGILVINRDGRFLQVNQRYCNIVGYSKAELLEMTFQDITHPDDLGVGEYHRQQLFESDIPSFSLEKRYIRKDGTIRWVKLTISLAHRVLDQHPSLGETHYEIAIVEDIHDRKLVEAELRDSQRFIQRIADTNPNMLYLFDLTEHRNLYVNREVGAVLGYSPHELQAMGSNFLARLIHPNDSDAMSRNFAKIMNAEDGAVIEFEYRLLDKFGHWRWMCSWDTVFARDADGCPTQILGSAADITDRKQTEETLLQQAQDLLALLENTPDAIMRVDQDGRYRYVNSVVVKDLEISVQDILGKRIQDLQISEALAVLWQHTITEVFQTGEERSLEYEMTLPSGTKYYFSRIVPEFSVEGTVDTVLVVARDITELKQAERRLRNQAQRERVISEITSRIRRSLDLNTILSTTVNEVRQLLQCDRVLIYQFTPDDDGLVIKESVAEGWRSLQGLVIDDSCLSPERCVAPYQHGYIQNTADIYTANLDKCYIQLLESLQVRANLVIGVLLDEQVWGLLVAQHCQAPRPWEPWEIDLLKQLSEQLSIALQQSQLYTQTQQQAQRQAALNQVIQAIRSSLEVDMVFKTAANAVGELLQVDQVSIVQHQLYNYTWLIVEEYRRSDHIPSSVGVQIPDQNNPLADALKQRFPVKVDATSTLSDPVNQDIAQLFPGAWLLVPVCVGDTLWGSLTLKMFQSSHRWQDWEIEIAKTVADQLAIAIQQSQLYEQLQRANKELERLATTDSLTQIANRLRFDSYLSREWQRLAREQQPLSLIMCDVDHFKEYNDTYGHQSGDDCLVQIAQALQSSVRRPADLVTRYGGEEFAIILPNTSQQGAIQVAEIILTKIRDSQIPHTTSKIDNIITVSLGIGTALPVPGTSPQQLLAIADEALYQSKSHGRNRMSCLDISGTPALFPRESR